MSVVLVVEDDVDLLASLDDALTEEGWTVVAAPSASIALKAARSRRIDVVLTDLVMAFGDGEDLQAAFRNDQSLQAVPFVFMTAAHPQARELTGVSVILKPFAMYEVFTTLKRCLASAARMEAP
jgi:DNA-binding response OmpR family regulator